MLEHEDKPDGVYSDGPGSNQIRAEYPNGFGASIIKGGMAYGGLELAVFHGGMLCYATPVTNDVIGWLTPAKLIETLHLIAALERNDACDHAKPDTYDPLDEDHSEGKASILDAFESFRRM